MNKAVIAGKMFYYLLYAGKIANSSWLFQMSILNLNYVNNS